MEELNGGSNMKKNQITEDQARKMLSSIAFLLKNKKDITLIISCWKESGYVENIDVYEKVEIGEFKIKL